MSFVNHNKAKLKARGYNFTLSAGFFFLTIGFTLEATFFPYFINDTGFIVVRVFGLIKFST